ncbi:MAG TPA: MFS transporter [Rhabdochlamydiaceae bacterium]
MAEKEKAKISLNGCKETRFALLGMNLANEPLITLYTLLPFILCKDLNVSTFQLSLFLSLRPVLSVFSFYWSAYLKEGKGKLLSNFVWACVLAYLPFVFFPLVGNTWYLLAASALYQLFSRAALPSLIEILKRNMPKKPREHAFSLFFLLSFIESGILGLVLGGLFDNPRVNWQWLFAIAGLIGLSAIFLFRKVSVPQKEVESAHSSRSLTRPWKESASLLRKHADFAQFQWIFMIGGSALMLMAPAFSRYYASTLSLSHTDIAVARFVFMAIGVAVSTPFWRKCLEKMSVLQLTLWILFGFGLFAFVLLLAQYHFSFLYLGFLIYGIAQAGSHFIWNLSGTFFCAEQDSTPYSRVNLLMVGIRGAIFPFIGGMLCDLWGPVAVLCLGMSLCFLGAAAMRNIVKRHALQPSL